MLFHLQGISYCVSNRQRLCDSSCLFYYTLDNISHRIEIANGFSKILLEGALEALEARAPGLPWTGGAITSRRYGIMRRSRLFAERVRHSRAESGRGILMDGMDRPG